MNKQILFLLQWNTTYLINLHISFVLETILTEKFVRVLLLGHHKSQADIAYNITPTYNLSINKDDLFIVYIGLYDNDSQRYLRSLQTCLVRMMCCRSISASSGNYFHCWVCRRHYAWFGHWRRTRFISSCPRSVTSKIFLLTCDYSTENN